MAVGEEGLDEAEGGEVGEDLVDFGLDGAEAGRGAHEGKEEDEDGRAGEVEDLEAEQDERAEEGDGGELEEAIGGVGVPLVLHHLVCDCAIAAGEEVEFCVLRAVGFDDLDVLETLHGGVEDLAHAGGEVAAGLVDAAAGAALPGEEETEGEEDEEGEPGCEISGDAEHEQGDHGV